MEQFLRICQQNTDQIGLKFCELAHYGPPQTWLTFGHIPLNFHHFLASGWWGSFHAFDQIWLKFPLQTHNEPPGLILVMLH